MTSSNDTNKSGAKRTFTTGSVRDLSEGKGRFDLLPWRALTLLAKHFEKGAEKYGDDNWRKGQPVKRSFLDSGTRHLSQFMTGQRDEDHPTSREHLTAACWNLLCALETLVLIDEGKLPEELIDLEWTVQDEEIPPPIEMSEQAAFDTKWKDFNPRLFTWSKGDGEVFVDHYTVGENQWMASRGRYDTSPHKYRGDSPESEEFYLPSLYTSSLYVPKWGDFYAWLDKKADYDADKKKLGEQAPPPASDVVEETREIPF